MTLVREAIATQVENSMLPGAVAYVQHKGSTSVEAVGRMSVNGPPMARDTIFRITSMTKPVAAVATMILVEEGKLALDAPVDRLLPELADRKVLRSIDAPVDETVPAVRPITVRDLLSLRLGFGIIMAPPGTYPIQDALDELELHIGPPIPATPHSPDEWMRRFGTLPLLHQPGERWAYHAGISVAGVLIARAAGMPLERFLEQRIFAPLGMSDTGFDVPASKLDRFSTAYQGAGADLVPYDGVEDSQWAAPPAFPDAGDGLVSTIDDYAAFAQMMFDGGGEILSRSSVEAMTTDQLTPEQHAASGDIPMLLGSRGWGLGISVSTERGELGEGVGRYGWDGGLCTSWYCDPANDLFVILMAQRLAGADVMGFYADFWGAVYRQIAA